MLVSLNLHAPKLISVISYGAPNVEPVQDDSNDPSSPVEQQDRRLISPAAMSPSRRSTAPDRLKGTKIGKAFEERTELLDSVDRKTEEMLSGHERAMQKTGGLRCRRGSALNIGSKESEVLVANRLGWSSSPFGKTRRHSSKKVYDSAEECSQSSQSVTAS